jgi:hypothetical protein
MARAGVFLWPRSARGHGWGAPCCREVGRRGGLRPSRAAASVPAGAWARLRRPPGACQSDAKSAGCPTHAPGRPVCPRHRPGPSRPACPRMQRSGRRPRARPRRRRPQDPRPRSAPVTLPAPFPTIPRSPSPSFPTPPPPPRPRADPTAPPALWRIEGGMLHKSSTMQRGGCGRGGWWRRAWKGPGQTMRGAGRGAGDADALLATRS